MKTPKHNWLILALAASVLTGMVRAARSSDVSTPRARSVSVDLANQLADPKPLPALRGNEVNPFNPPAFSQPDEEELAAIAAARAAESAALAKSRPKAGPELLERLAEMVTPSGTLTLGEQQILILGTRQMRVGDHLTVTLDQRDYDLELTGIDRTTFKLRLNRDEITRRIQPRKNP